MKFFGVKPFNPNDPLNNKSSREVNNNHDEYNWGGPCKPVPIYVYRTTCPYPETVTLNTCPYPETVDLTTCSLPTEFVVKTTCPVPDVVYRNSSLFPYGIIEGMTVLSAAPQEAFTRGALIDSIGNTSITEFAVNLKQMVKYTTLNKITESIGVGEISDMAVGLKQLVSYSKQTIPHDSLQFGTITDLGVSLTGSGIDWVMKAESIAGNTISAVGVNFIKVK